MTTFDTANNITGMSDLVVYGSNVSGGFLGLMILLMVFFISFMAMRNRASEQPGVNAKIFLASSFLTSVVSVLLMMIGAINEITVYVCVAGTAIAIFANVIGNRTM